MHLRCPHLSNSIQDSLSIDPHDNYTLQDAGVATIPPLRSIHHRQFAPLPERRFSVVLEADTFQQFISPTALLNDNSVNGIALMLQTQMVRQRLEHPHIFDAATIAILSTHDLVRI